MSNKNRSGMCYNVDRWDMYQLEKQTEAQFENVHSELTSDRPSFDGLIGDIFHRLHNPTPTMKEKIAPENTWGLNAHNELSQMTEFASLESSCKNDPILSAVGTYSFAKVLHGHLPVPDDNQDVDQLREQARALSAMMKDLESSGKPVPSQMHDTLNALQTQGRKAVQSALQYAEQVRHDMRDILYTAAKRAQKDVAEARDVLDNMGGWSNDATGKPSRNPDHASAYMNLYKQISSSDKMRRVFDIAGRFRRIADRKQSQKHHEPTTITDITLSNQVDRLIGSEAVKFDPDLEMLFYKQFVERSLMTYELKDTTPLGKGPIVVCIDESGSMEGPRDEFAKALALGLMHVAIRQKRDFAIVHFDSRVHATSIYQRDDFKDETKILERVINDICTFSGGGTNYQYPLEEAIKIIYSGTRFEKADIVFITDDECKLGKWTIDFVKAKSDIGCSLYGIGVCCYPKNLSTIADQVWTASHLFDETIDSENNPLNVLAL